MTPYPAVALLVASLPFMAPSINREATSIPHHEQVAVVRSLRIRPTPTPPKARTPRRTRISASVGKVERIIHRAAREWGVDGARMVRVARCESGLDPRAQSPSGKFLGLFQQHRDFWPDRARKAGLAGASVFDPWANAYVSARMIAVSGWHHWPVCGA